tara:strand:+ start:692 stop:1126 length:435 start_codon:yes stop_codon:yes gene_type:complete
MSSINNFCLTPTSSCLGLSLNSFSINDSSCNNTNYGLNQLLLAKKKYIYSNNKNNVISGGIFYTSNSGNQLKLFDIGSTVGLSKVQQFVNISRGKNFIGQITPNVGYQNRYQNQASLNTNPNYKNYPVLGNSNRPFLLINCNNN